MKGTTGVVASQQRRGHRGGAKTKRAPRITRVGTAAQQAANDALLRTEGKADRKYLQNVEALEWCIQPVWDVENYITHVKVTSSKGRATSITAKVRHPETYETSWKRATIADVYNVVREREKWLEGLRMNGPIDYPMMSCMTQKLFFDGKILVD